MNMRVIIEKEIKNIKFYSDINGDKMEVPHPGVLVRIINDDFTSKYLFFSLTSNAKDFGIKVRKNDGSVVNASVETEALVYTKLKTYEDLKKAIAYYTEKGQRRKAENLKVGDVVEFYDPKHRSEFNKFVPVFKSSRDFYKTDSFIKESKVKLIYKKIALFLEKGVYHFYESPNMFNTNKVENITKTSLTEEETQNLIMEMKKRSE